jgi:cytosine/adenosine deaminase-related metal-dependent hydrolase
MTKSLLKLLQITIATTIALGFNAFAAEDTPPSQVLFKNVNIFNGTENKLYENHSVLVENNLIKTISAGEIKTNADATVIDGGGKTLMPGLIDSHVHLNMYKNGTLLDPRSAKHNMGRDWGAGGRHGR